jgi:sialate O-acetylesterase
MPFYYVQLSSLNRPSWPLFRDSQRRMLQDIDNSGMAVSTDKGNPTDVHPTEKREVGQRLAYWALNETYGFRNVVPSGPLYSDVEFKKGAAYVSFDYDEGLRPAKEGEELLTFEIAGEDRRFYPAKAVVEGNRVKVWSKEVKNPTIVRYGWQPYTKANLVNGAGLPASTFRSDY